MTKLRSDGKVSNGAVVMLEIATWQITRSRGAQDVGTFDSGDWTDKDYQKASWTGSCSGYVADGDTTGQDILETAFNEGTILPNIRFWLEWSETSTEQITYYAADTVTDSDAGVLITSFDITKDQATQTATISFNFEGTGPLKKTIDTVA